MYESWVRLRQWYTTCISVTSYDVLLFTSLVYLEIHDSWMNHHNESTIRLLLIYKYILSSISNFSVIDFLPIKSMWYNKLRYDYVQYTYLYVIVVNKIMYILYCFGYIFVTITNEWIHYKLNKCLWLFTNPVTRTYILI